MTYDYFYGQQAEMFTFYRVPKVLFTEDCFWNVSTDAKLLYGILLDRMNLSARNGWLDEEGRVYIIFTIEEIKGALGCAEKKAVKLLDELEKKCGLIERKRQGLGKPNLIYVKNFISGSVERQFLNCQKDNSGVVKNTMAAVGPHTPGYGAPELFQYSKSKIDSRADLFSIGVVVYQSIFGEHPFITGKEVDYNEIWYRTATVTPKNYLIPGDKDSQLIGLIQTLMQKQVSKRPPSAKKALEWFYTVLGTLSI